MNQKDLNKLSKLNDKHNMKMQKPEVQAAWEYLDRKQAENKKIDNFVLKCEWFFMGFLFAIIFILFLIWLVS